MCTLVDMQKLCYGNGGAYMNGYNMSHVYPRHAIVGANTLMPMYPVYQYHHPTETIGVPAQTFYQTAPWHLGPAPVGIMSKPSSIIPHTGALYANIPTLSMCNCSWEMLLIFLIQFFLTFFIISWSLLKIINLCAFYLSIIFLVIIN